MRVQSRREVAATHTLVIEDAEAQMAHSVVNYQWINRRDEQVRAIVELFAVYYPDIFYVHGGNQVRRGAFHLEKARSGIAGR
jgi:hypothetical protein